MSISLADDSNKSMLDKLIIFSEHHVAFSAGHDIKLLNIDSKKETVFGVKTCSYGDFYIVKSSNIAWIGDNRLYIYDPLTKSTGEKALSIEQPPSVFLISVSPSGNKVAYLNPYGKCVQLQP
jgi:predicted nucleic-acid-binding Zn-ribbon protein